MLPKFFFSLLVCLVFFSCKKEKDQDHGPLVITINDLENMIVKTPPIPTEVDLDEDGIIDLSLVEKFNFKPYANREFVSLTLHCHHENVALRTMGKVDTTFLNRTISTYTINYSSLIQKHVTLTHACHRMSPLDKIETISPLNAKLKFSSKGEVVRRDDPYSSGDFILIDSDTQTNASTISADTSYHQTEIFRKNCHSALEPLSYIAFSITTNDRVRLGWVRFNIGSSVMLIETAISK